MSSSASDDPVRQNMIFSEILHLRKVVKNRRLAYVYPSFAFYA